jgi:hypothetical protein
MNADFLDALRRHLRDADYLFSASHLANADHLYGMAAECGLKRLMRAFGMKLRPADGAPEKREDREHADKVFARYETYRSGPVQGVQYGLPFSTNPFNDWKAEQRYAQEQCFDHARVEPHQTAAYTIHALVKKAEMAGLI